MKPQTMHRYISLQDKTIRTEVFRNNSDKEFLLQSGQVVAYGTINEHSDLIIPKSEADLKYLAGIAVTNGPIKLFPRERVEVSLIIEGKLNKDLVIFPDDQDIEKLFEVDTLSRGLERLGIIIETE